VLLRRSGERHPSQGLKAGVDLGLEEFAGFASQREFRLDRDVQKAIRAVLKGHAKQ